MIVRQTMKRHKLRCAKLAPEEGNMKRRKLGCAKLAPEEGAGVQRGAYCQVEMMKGGYPSFLANVAGRSATRNLIA